MTTDEALAQHAALLSNADALRARGDLTNALGGYRAAGAVLERLSTVHGNAAPVLAAVVATKQRLGETLIAQGDLAAALVALRAELAMRRQIADAGAHDLHGRDEVKRAAARVAEVLVLKSAIASLQGGEAGAPLRRPGEASWTLSAAAGALEAQGNLGGALALYREGLAIRRRLAAQEPDNVDWAHDVTLSLTGLGGALMARGDVDGALASLGEALAIRRMLAAREPDSAQRRLDLSWTLMVVGEVLAKKGDHGGALTALREALTIRRALSSADQENEGLHCDIAVSLTRIAEVLAACGDRHGAAAAYREARDLVQELVAHAPARAEWREDLSAIDECIAGLAAVA